MSSVQSVVASPSHGARFFVARNSTSATANTIYTALGVAGTGKAAGTVVRDMGKTIRTPGISALDTSVTTQLVLRKVALVGASPAATTLSAGGLAPTTGFVGFSEGAQDARNASLTFYINVYDGNWVSA